MTIFLADINEFAVVNKVMTEVMSEPYPCLLYTSDVYKRQGVVRGLTEVGVVVRGDLLVALREAEVFASSRPPWEWK